MDDEITEDFLRMQGRQWNIHGSTSGEEGAVKSPFEKKREEIVRSNQETLQLTVNTGKISRNVAFSMPGCLMYRENGMAPKYNFDAQVLRLKLRQLKLVCNSRVDPSNMINCYYVNRYSKGLLGAWTYHEFSATSIKALSFKFSKLQRKSNSLQSSILDVHLADIITLPGYKVFDLCSVTSSDVDFILYVANSYSRSNNIAHLTSVGIYSSGDHYDDVRRRFEHQEILWSCAWNNFRRRFAIGALRCFYLHDYESFSKRIDIPDGQPYSLAFNSIGNILYCGLHNGKLVCYDLRAEDTVPVLTIALCKNISYIKLLSDERSVIVSGYNSALLNVDLRSQKAVFQYPSHYSLYKKLIFSVNEDINVLCAPGEDNITRLWSLKDGKPLHALPLPEKDYCG